MTQPLPPYDFDLTHPDYPDIELAVRVTDAPYPPTRFDPGHPGDYEIVGWTRGNRRRAVRAWCETRALEVAIIAAVAEHAAEELERDHERSLYFTGCY